MAASTYVTTVGRFGRAIGARLAPSPTFAVAPVEGPDELPRERHAELIPAYARRLAAELGPLLRRGATSGEDGHGRLDLLLVADLEEVGGGLLAGLCDAMSAVLAEHFSVMFPPGTPPDQRSVGLVVVLATPALDATDRGRAALDGVRRIERWHLDGPPSPILNRVFLLPRQTEAMPLSNVDVERAVHLFVTTATLPGLRDSEPMRRRLGPPRDPRRLVDSFIVAAADVDVDRVQAAFGWRSAITGLERLAAHCEGRRGATVHPPELDVSAWFAPLADDGPARALRAAAGTTQPLLALDQAEADGLLAARRAAWDLVDARLGGDDGLLGYRAVTQGLILVEERLRTLAAEPREGWLPPAPSAEEVAPAIEAPSRVPAPARPVSGLNLALSALLLAAVTGTAAAALSAVGAVRANAGPASATGSFVQGGAAPIGASTLETVGTGAGVGALLGIGWALAARAVAARRQRAVEDDAPAVAPQSAQNRQRSQKIDRSLALRRRRLARGALALIEDERRRLEALRGAVLAAQRHAADSLKDLGVTAGQASTSDDYGRLLDPATPLHAALVPAAALPALWERTREVRDDDTWAARLLAASYTRGGHREDLPFAPGAAWEVALREQHATVRTRAVFDWPDLRPILHEEVRRFLAEVPRALKLGVRPRRPDGTPEPLPDARELLVVAPPEGRGAVEAALAVQPILDAAVFTGAGLPGVLVLRTAGELDTAALERGT